MNQAPRVMSQQQLMLMEENSSFVEQREKEIQNVVRSIFELNTIFKVILNAFLYEICTRINLLVFFFFLLGNIAYGCRSRHSTGSDRLQY